MQQVYNGYANGGDFKWSAIPDEYTFSLAFNRDGSFSESLPVSWFPNQCSGSYVLINENELKVNSSCYTEPYSIIFYVSEKYLIITHRVIEGEIKEKFIKTN